MYLAMPGVRGERTPSSPCTEFSSLRDCPTFTKMSFLLSSRRLQPGIMICK